MNSAGRFSIDLTTWADYWDLIEENGLNSDVVHRLAPDLESPILIVGSGQGLVSARCIALGHNVWSVDKSAAMADRALHRRRVPTIVGDVFEVELAMRFKTILVSTGIINERTLDEAVLPRLMASVRRLLADDGRLVLAYFRRSLWTDIATELGLYGRPSRNLLFWQARGDLAHAEQKFSDAANRPADVHRVFSEHYEPLARHQDFITRVGQRHQMLAGREPDAFIAEHSGYYPFPLTREAERQVEDVLGSERLSRRTLVVNGGDTSVHVCRANGTG